MKLKIKHVQQPQHVHRLDVPNNASFAELISVVAAAVPFAGAVVAKDIALSLNKKVRCMHGVAPA